MRTSYTFVFPLAALLIILQFAASPAATTGTNIEYIRHSCGSTLYPRLCYNSLAVYATKINTNPKTLAATALNLTLSATKATVATFRHMAKAHVRFTHSEAAAMQDCLEEVGDAVDELNDSIGEMNHPPKDKDFELTMSDIQTWVSAALTDEDTCMDGFAGHAMDGNLKATVRRHILRVAHLTSNALALVNNYVATERSASPP